ncbi:MAG: 1,4-dihydroxy-6-naphthoate synthase [Bacteroidia bacterium]|nr:1,4-dihydroxy-6-naphthoate synthase [Bacteroidia bacterium]
MISLAYSTCPNDTFIFGAWAEKKIAAPDVAVRLMDIDELNALAATGGADVCKVSFHAYWSRLSNDYDVCEAGAALGRGCGPLLVARKNERKKLTEATVAVPGMETTARLLLQFYSSTGPQTVVRFDKIMPAVAEGRFDFGLIIHESRFTYSDYGLECIQDLGEYWEKRTGLPIPLGGIAVRKTLPESFRRELADVIRRSLAFARTNPAAVWPYVKKYAGEMDDDVIRRHIDLYVNDFSIDLGAEGKKAIEQLKKLLI